MAKIRLKIANFLLVVAAIAWGILLLCLSTGQYVGVYIFYVCIPLGTICGLLGWWIYPKD